MKNTSTITLILLTITLSIPQMAHAAMPGCSTGVRRNLLPSKMDLSDFYSSGVAVSPSPEASASPASASQVRLPVGQDLLAAHPELKGVGSALMDFTGLALSSSKVSQCIVMINLHVFDNASKMKSATGTPLMDGLMKMTEEQLSDSPNTRFTLGFLPNGQRGFKEGHDILVSGKVIKTGRRIALGTSQLEQKINRYNDYILLKVENPTRDFLALPIIQLASPEEINNAATNNEKGSIFGQPKELVESGQRIYYQKDVNLELSADSLLRHEGVITPGGSGSVIAIEVGSTYKMVGVGNVTRRDPKGPSVEGVHVAAFRNAVAEAQSIKCD